MYKFYKYYSGLNVLKVSVCATSYLKKIMCYWPNHARHDSFKSARMVVIDDFRRMHVFLKLESSAHISI